MLSAATPTQSAANVHGLAFYLVYIWSVGGVAALLASALWRLVPVAWEPIAQGTLSLSQAILYGAWVVFNAYCEGYRAFHKAFCPRVVARAFHLATHPKPLSSLFGPAFAMSLFHAHRRGLSVAWLSLVAITALVLIVKALPQPWRGLVDGGVVVGLGWGLAALLGGALGALRRGPPPIDMQLPAADARALSAPRRK